jgi:predicted CXXCH cytochrome family protein
MMISQGIGSAWRSLVPGVAGLLVTILGISAPAVAETAAGISAADAQCLTCHSMTRLNKTLGDGEKLSLHVGQEDFSQSIHSIIGCRGCHRDIDPEVHPVMRSIADAQEYSIEASAVCRNCHADKSGQYESSIHASLVATGNAAAPLCSSCHDPHAVRRASTLDPATGQPCKSCHEEIFAAYAGSVHGQARVGAGEVRAPFCSDCHKAHEVTAAVAGTGLKQACLSCHETAPSAHDEWLPNSRRHLEAVACPACHSPMAERSVDLRLYDGETGEWLASDPGFAARAAAIDTAGDGLDPLELWALVRETNREHDSNRLSLRGRLEVTSGAQAHQLAFKQQAVRNCDTCHQLGAETYDSVTVSVGDPDGRRVRYAAGEDTLTSAVSVGSVGGFYTAGGTRIRLLDILLVLGVLAGLGIPVMHWTMRKLARKKG